MHLPRSELSCWRQDSPLHTWLKSKRLPLLAALLLVSMFLLSLFLGVGRANHLEKRLSRALLLVGPVMYIFPATVNKLHNMVPLTLYVI